MADFTGKSTENPQGFLNIAHRGASAYAPENTAAAIEEAIARNADMVEFDLRRTSDGVIVLHHDDSVYDIDDKKTPVSRIPFAELREICRIRGFELATFEEILSSFGDRIRFNIEIKIGGMERDVISLLKTHKPAFAPVISSFKPEILRKIKKLDSAIRVGLIVGSKNLSLLSALARPFIKKLLGGQEYDNFHIHKSLVTSDVVYGLIDAGYDVYVWTVNDPDEIKEMLNLGVMGIISDCPDVVYETCMSLTGIKEPVLAVKAGISPRFSYSLGRLRSV